MTVTPRSLQKSRTPLMLSWASGHHRRRVNLLSLDEIHYSTELARHESRFTMAERWPISASDAPCPG